MNNIQKINKKFIQNNNEINLGFIVINYGTSIEEYMSYLLHPTYGYLTSRPLSKTNIDALIIFSLCTETDLLMDNIIKNKHLFVVVNDNSNHYKELKEMRLTNNIIEINDKNLIEIFKEEYRIFQGINENGIVTIQKAGFSKEQLNSMIKYVNEMSSLIEMTKKL